MKSDILGEYDFRNNTMVNISNHNEDDINLTILHETIHLMITQQTRWGLFCYCVRRIQVYDNSYKHIMDYLCEQSRKVQEGAAVFAECIYLIQNFGYFKCSEYIKELQKNNKEYYNYVRPLMFFLELLNSTDNYKTKVSANDLNSFILGVAKVAMNPQLLEIPVEVLKSKKLFRKVISNNEMACKFLPNKRFKILLKTSCDIILEQGNFNIDEIIEQISICHESERDNFKEVFYTNDTTVKRYEEFLSNTKEYFKKLYGSSGNREPIEIFLNSIKAKEIDIKDLPQYSIPFSFSKFESVKTEHNEVLTLAKNKKGVLFYLGNIGDMKDFDSDLAYIPEKVMTSVKELLKEKSYISIYYDYESKKAHNSNSSKRDIENLICTSELTIVVNYKVFDKNKDDIKGLDTKQKPIFVYCDRSYPKSINLINELLTEKAKCRIIQYNSMYLLIIKISSKSQFILPVLPISYEQVLNDIKHGVINIELADNPDGETMIDEYILTSYYSIEQYDLIINSLFQVKN